MERTILLKLKNLARYKSKNNFVWPSKHLCRNVDDNVAKSSNNLAISLNALIILMIQTKLSSDLYLTECLDTLAKPFFPYIKYFENDSKDNELKKSGASN